MAVEVSIDAQAGRDLTTLARRLKTLGDGRTVPNQFRATLRTGATIAARDARSAARNLPSKNQGKSVLRADIARAIQPQVKLARDPTVAVRISRRSLGGRASIPRLSNYKGFWTHPTFGHGPTEIQMGQKGWFDDVMRKASPVVRRELERRVAEFERKLMANV